MSLLKKHFEVSLYLPSPISWFLNILKKIILDYSPPQALLLFTLLSGSIASQRRGVEEKVDDETIQSIVYQKAKRLGYGLRILPKVKVELSDESSIIN